MTEQSRRSVLRLLCGAALAPLAAAPLFGTPSTPGIVALVNTPGIEFDIGGPWLVDGQLCPMTIQWSAADDPDVWTLSA